MPNLDATHRILSLGNRDSTTGWFQANYYNETDNTGEAVKQKLLLITKSSQRSVNIPGIYVRTDALGLVLHPVKEGDQYITGLNQRYEVSAVRDELQLGGNSISFKQIDLTLLQLENLTATSYIASSFEDAKYRTKVWLELHLNRVTLPSFIVAYGFPGYPLERVFKDKGVDVVFSIGEPISTALYTYDKLVYGYEEKVPIVISCIDKEGSPAVKLLWKAETELRRLCETYPFGSLRLMDSRRDKTERLGSTLYQTEFMINYKRSSGLVPTSPTITWGSYDEEEEEWEGTFIFPNVTRLSLPIKTEDAWLKPLDFTGNLNQAMGSEPMEIEMTCDLDIAPRSLTWKRSSTAPFQSQWPKSDGDRYDVFLDIIHNEGIDEPYHILTFGSKSLKVRLVSMTPDLTDDGNKITLLFREYREDSASTEAFKDRFGMA